MLRLQWNWPFLLWRIPISIYLAIHPNFLFSWWRTVCSCRVPVGRWFRIALALLYFASIFLPHLSRVFSIGRVWFASPLIGFGFLIVCRGWIAVLLPFGGRRICGLSDGRHSGLLRRCRRRTSRRNRGWCLCGASSLLFGVSLKKIFTPASVILLFLLGFFLKFNVVF